MNYTVSTTELTLKDAMDHYENGKHRRYSLLFAANGGAFAVARLMGGEIFSSHRVLGRLTLFELSVGMALFTAVMTYDIFIFGEKMRTTFLPKAFGREG